MVQVLKLCDIQVSLRSWAGLDGDAAKYIPSFRAESEEQRKLTQTYYSVQLGANQRHLPGLQDTAAHAPRSCLASICSFVPSLQSELLHTQHNCDAVQREV